MQQLSALDNLMLEGEMPNIPLHMSALMIYDTGGKRGSTRLRKILDQRIEQVLLAHFPILRCKVERLPMHLDRAYWVEDGNFAVTNHVAHSALPQGQDWQALYQMFGEFHALPLDTSRPLWQSQLVEGLNRLDGVPPGATAVMLKIHHSVFDGKGALRLISSLHNLSQKAGGALLLQSMETGEQENADYQRPSVLSKYSRAWWHSIERPIDFTKTLLKLLPGLWKSGGGEGKGAGGPTPHTYFNTPVSANRVVGHVRMEMTALKSLKKRHGCTINDVALCVISGAMRTYLLERDRLPAEDLCTMMPVSVRKRDEEGSLGNHVSIAKVPLYCHTENVRERLQNIHSDAFRGKRKSRGGGSGALLELVDEVHPAVLLWLGEWLISSGKIDSLPQLVNTVVTNVPGNSQELYIGDAKLVDYLGFGPLAPNVGLFHTVSSTEDHVNISFLSTPELLGDGQAYSDCLVQSWQQTSRARARHAKK